MPESTTPPFSRIRSAREIKEIRSMGRRWRGKNVSLWALPGESAESPPALGVVTGKGFRTAVARNLARRRARGCIMELRDLFRPGYKYLVEVRPRGESEDYQMLVKDIEDVLSRTGIARRGPG